MKRWNYLYDKIWLLDNLKRAFKKAAKGKRQHAVVRQFEKNLTSNLVAMRDLVKSGEYSFGRFHSFVIHDPKSRIIHACRFEERVLHHAIMNICHRCFDQRLINDTFACRPGQGRVAALTRAQQHGRKHKYYLKLDISRYFDSIDHRILKRQLYGLFKEPPLLELFFSVIDSYHGRTEKGLPIGILTSQYFANGYLGGLDRFIKETLKAPAYSRYMDDFVLWHDNQKVLGRWMDDIECYAKTRLSLELHPKRRIAHCREGLPFLGLRLHPRYRWLGRRGRKNYQRRIREYENHCILGLMGANELQRRFDALHAATDLADSLAWRDRFWQNREVLDI